MYVFFCLWRTFVDRASIQNIIISLTCPKKRVIYTHASLWAAASRERNNNNDDDSNANSDAKFSPACVHWTGEKPWSFQKRKDLQDLVGKALIFIQFCCVDLLLFIVFFYSRSRRNIKAIGTHICVNGSATNTECQRATTHIGTHWTTNDCGNR